MRTISEPACGERRHLLIAVRDRCRRCRCWSSTAPRPAHPADRRHARPPAHLRSSRLAPRARASRRRRYQRLGRVAIETRAARRDPRDPGASWAPGRRLPVDLALTYSALPIIVRGGPLADDLGLVPAVCVRSPALAVGIAHLDHDSSLEAAPPLARAAPASGFASVARPARPGRARRRGPGSGAATAWHPLAAADRRRPDADAGAPRPRPDASTRRRRPGTAARARRPLGRGVGLHAGRRIPLAVALAVARDDAPPRSPCPAGAWIPAALDRGGVFAGALGRVGLLFGHSPVDSSCPRDPPTHVPHLHSPPKNSASATTPSTIAHPRERAPRTRHCKPNTPCARIGGSSVEAGLRSAWATGRIARHQRIDVDAGHAPVPARPRG